MKNRKTAVLGLFAALIVVLQFLSYMVSIGVFNISLVLVPVVLAAVMYGKWAGGAMGFIFGVVVTVCSAIGLDKGGFILFSANPFLTSLICLLKGSAAGFVAGIVYKSLKDKKPYVAVLLAAVVTPVVNTGIFIIGMLTCFSDILYSWAGGTNIVTYIVVGLVGVNFLIELVVNVILSSGIHTVIKSLQK